MLRPYTKRIKSRGFQTVSRGRKKLAPNGEKNVSTVDPRPSKEKSWGGSLQLDPGTATLRIIMKGLDLRRQIYDMNVAIGGHNYIPSAAQILVRIEIK